MTSRSANAFALPTALLCALVAVGCSSGDDDDSSAPAPTVVNAPSDDPSGVDVTGVTTVPGNTVGTGDPMIGAGATSPFDGEWQLACGVNDPEDLTEGYAVQILTIGGQVASLRSLEYTDSACSVPGTPAEIVLGATLALTGGTTDTSLGQAVNVDITFDTLTVDGVSQAVAPETVYDIAFTTGSELYFGDETADPARNATSPETRPTVLGTPPLVRQ